MHIIEIEFINSFLVFLGKDVGIKKNLILTKSTTLLI